MRLVSDIHDLKSLNQLMNKAFLSFMKKQKWKEHLRVFNQCQPQ